MPGKFRSGKRLAPPVKENFKSIMETLPTYLN